MEWEQVRHGLSFFLDQSLTYRETEILLKLIEGGGKMSAKSLAIALEAKETTLMSQMRGLAIRGLVKKERSKSGLIYALAD